MNRNLSIVIIVICVIMSAYFSATETAFTSLNRIRMKNYAEKGKSGAILVMKLLERQDDILSTILIGNNVVNILATSLATVIFVQMLGEDMGSGVSTLVTTLVLLIFGEISPKSMALQYAESFAMFSAPILRVLVIILTPLNVIFGLWKKLLTLLVRGEEDHGITEEELLTMVDEAKNDGGINEQEQTLIQNAIEFTDQEAQDILTPRIDITAIEVTTSEQEIADVFADSGYSRLPVYEEDIDHIIGTLNQKDFYTKAYGRGKDIRPIVRPVVFIPEHKHIGVLLREMQQQKTHMAVVLDEYGGTEGILTMEDILEELVGEIWDEHDEVVQEIRMINETKYIVLGSAPVEKLADELDTEIETESLTVSGWVMELAGTVPKQGQLLEQGQLQVRVLEMDGPKVEKVQILIVPEEENADDD
ncbi:MAG: hemolysin family protein [Eubacterium sp.]|nr:hemolysin family protein [Eubacterium sp.]